MLGSIFQPQLEQNCCRFVTREEQRGHAFDVLSSLIWTFPPQYPQKFVNSGISAPQTSPFTRFLHFILDILF